MLQCNYMRTLREIVVSSSDPCSVVPQWGIGLGVRIDGLRLGVLGL